MKTFVLDTNVLLHDPDSILYFQDNKVAVTMIVVEELDSFKKSNDERGRSSRLISRKPDALRSKGTLSDGVSTKMAELLKLK